MAHTKAGGSTRNGRDSAGKRLGVKAYGGQSVTAGSIIVRQRGTRMECGIGTAMGRDQTIFATQAGSVVFTEKQIQKFSGRFVSRTIVSIG